MLELIGLWELVDFFELALNSYSKLVLVQVLDLNLFCKLVLALEAAEEEDLILADRLEPIHNLLKGKNYKMLMLG